MTMVGGDAFSSISLGRERRGSSAKLKIDKGKDREESGAPLGSWRHTDADTTTGIINLTLPLLVTPDAA